MHPNRLCAASAALLLATLGGCTLQDTATHWHGRTCPDGKPLCVTTLTSYGLHFAIVQPFLGATRLDELVERATAEIARSGSDGLRIVETESNNYWYAIPPFTWLFSPVAKSVSIEFTPSPRLLAEFDAAGRLPPPLADGPAAPDR